MRMELLPKIMVRPLIFIFTLGLVRTLFAKGGVEYLPWSLDMSMVLIGFFMLASISLIEFGKSHFKYTIMGAFLLTSINYPLNEFLQYFILSDPLKINPIVYLGEIVIAMTMTMIFAAMIQRVAENMHFKVLRTK